MLSYSGTAVHGVQLIPLRFNVARLPQNRLTAYRESKKRHAKVHLHDSKSHLILVPSPEHWDGNANPISQNGLSSIGILNQPQDDRQHVRRHKTITERHICYPSRQLENF
jgi:hypothetical protein